MKPGCDTCNGTGAALYAICLFCSGYHGNHEPRRVAETVRGGESIRCPACRDDFSCPPCSACLGTGLALAMGEVASHA